MSLEGKNFVFQILLQRLRCFTDTAKNLLTVQTFYTFLLRPEQVICGLFGNKTTQSVMSFRMGKEPQR